MVVGAFGASAGAWLGWRGGTSLPSDENARAVMQTVAPGTAVEISGRDEAVFGYLPSAMSGISVFWLPFGSEPAAGSTLDTWLAPLLGKSGYRQGSVGVRSAGDADEPLSAARLRLRAAGWDVVTNDAAETVVARRGPVVVSVWPSTNGGSGPRTWTATVRRAEPPAVLPLLLLGGLAGALAGWLQVVWTARRLAGASAPVRGALIASGGLSLCLLMPSAAVTTVMATIDILLPPTPPEAAMPILLVGPSAGAALLAWRLARRQPRLSWSSTVVGMVLAAVGAVPLMFGMMISALQAGSGFPEEYNPWLPIPVWGPYMAPGLRLSAILGLLAAAVVVSAAATLRNDHALYGNQTDRPNQYAHR
jgi:hypothetical protein